MHEELCIDEAELRTASSGIRVALPTELNVDLLMSRIDGLLHSTSDHECLQQLQDLLPEFQRAEHPPSVMSVS